MVAFLIDKITPRWEYTFDFIFGQRGIDFKLYDDFKTFDESKGVKHQLSCSCGKILREQSIFSGNIESGTWENQIVLTFDDQIDVLSSIFYVLTRMEEYQNDQWDNHGRFVGAESWQFKNGVLDQTICDRWAVAFIEFIEKETKAKLDFDISFVQIIPTFDIDNAFAYKYKTGSRRFLSKAKDLVQGNKVRLEERAQVLSGKLKDPYDGYGKILSTANTFPTRIFWLVGDYGKTDFNIAIETPEIGKLICDLGENSSIGIHPSYRSNSELALLKKEMGRMEKVTKRKTLTSRQHFLKLRFPETYHALLKNDLSEDFTMGFADQIGFRNGTARSFPWFDLSINERTDLLIRPFAYMDGSLNEYLKLSTDEAKKSIEKLFLEVEKYGGDFIFIWHNETITDHGIWKGWSSVLDFTLSLKKK
jgi:hypothetical protein